MRPGTIEREIRNLLRERPETTVFLRSDFTEALPQYSRTGMDKALGRMVERGEFLRIGYGLLARSEVRDSRFLPGEQVTCLTKSFYATAREALDRLGVPWDLDRATKAYNNDESTQVPFATAFNVGNSRITRKISLNRATLRYERGSDEPRTLRPSKGGRKTP